MNTIFLRFSKIFSPVIRSLMPVNVSDQNTPTILQMATKSLPNVLLFIVAFRVGLKLLCRTSYHPDEYYQFQEPALWLSKIDGMTNTTL